MNAFNLILITSGKKSEATAHIWVVSIDGRPASKVYCKSPYKAMRYAFLLKKRTGLNISDNSYAMAAALGKVQASLTLHSLARHLPHPRLLRDCTSQGCRHRACGRAHGSQCGRTAHSQSCGQAQEKAAHHTHYQESQGCSQSLKLNDWTARKGGLFCVHEVWGYL